MGTGCTRKQVRSELIHGWLSILNEKESKKRFENAHKQVGQRARLHVCCHFSLCTHAILYGDMRSVLRESWLMLAAGPVTLRNRIIRTEKQNSS